MIASAQALWWLALPVLLLPIWWHRQKRQRVKAEPLATARFLPAAPPRQLRIWRWEDVALLAVRCLLLVALIAWLAVTTIPWRADTVLIDPALTTPPASAAWIERQIAAAGFQDARRTPLPAGALAWLQANEHEWRSGARVLILAASLPMPARIPQFAHAVDIRIPPASTLPSAESPIKERHIALSAPRERLAAWRALFAAFDAAGTGNSRYILADAPTAKTELIVWDRAAAPPADWRAPLWWLPPDALPLMPAATRAPAQALSINGVALQIADSPRGRLWASSNWPPADADSARALYETWQALAYPAQPYAMPALSLPAGRGAPLAMPDTTPAAWLAHALLALFVLERLLSHVRRR
ncbi:BatA domain-containing protein [Pseudoduganella namucuonensis]|uniref:N-terminal double-transmembrane domain-containing protein n=1 Tax=Pseudoduganella namucuonensis TaxID=1035707 RepID=A0A1I7LDC6_9BURK|nr:BatA domain-containing protein [Pseudoduganella namucuonensis]SFV07700.1 N-terminal double-transmembrane domain-containing protein [Pseudoduganella namucuonensis]